MGRGNYDFDWSVTRALDSGYGSGMAQEPRELDASFSQDLYMPHSSALLHTQNPRDIRNSVMWTTGKSDEAGLNYDEFVENLDGEELC